MNKKELKFETPEKPDLNDCVDAKPDVSDFQEQEKAHALMKSLGLSVGDKIKDDGENFIVNPKMVLRGDSPERYNKVIEKVKIILTKSEINDLNSYIKLKKENEKIREKIYNRIDKRVMKFYKWDNEKKSSSVVGNPKEEIKEALQWLLDNETHGFSNTIYHLLSKEDKDYIYCYKCAWSEKPIPNIQEWTEENEGEYLVLTEVEADYRARESLEDDDYSWKCAVESGNTTEGFSDWVDSVLNIDGRGSILNHYDGGEEQEKIEGVWYCIYRTN